MKKFLKRSLVVYCCMAGLISCKRDVIQKNPPVVDCRITQLIMKTDRAKDQTGIFIYNGHGNPVEYTPTKYSPGSVKYVFRYDAQQRLTDYIGYYAHANAPQLYEFWVKYFYDDRNRIVLDSIYYYGSYGAAITNHARHTAYTVYTYDQQNRVVGTVYRQLFDKQFNGVIADYKYVYNDEGNLVVPGAAYDGHTSIYRTHNIWMFLSRNYSINNLKSAKAYNSKGLPTAFDHAAPRAAAYKFLEFLDLSNCEIVYDCK